MSYGSQYNLSARVSYLEGAVSTILPYIPTTLSSVLSFGNNAGSSDIDMNNNDITNIKDLDVDGNANFTSTSLGSLTSQALQPPSSDSSTKIPTTAWVQTAITGGGGPAPNLSQVLLAGNSAGITSINMNNNDITNIKDLEVDGNVNFTSTLSGSVTSLAIQPLSSDSSTKIPTTAWVQTAITNGPAPNLSQVLLAGNSAGLTSLNMNSNAISNAGPITTSGVLTTTNAINMTGTSTLLNNISTRQISLKDATNGNSNGTSILTNGNVLTVDSVGPSSTDTLTQFAIRNTTNDIIIPLLLTPTVNNMNVALDMSGSNSTLATVRSRVYGFRDVALGTPITTRIYQDNLALALDNTQLNSSIIFQTRTSANATVTPLSIGNTVNNMNVALDMTNTDTTAFGYLNAQVRARLFELRDLNTAVTLPSCGMYFSGNNLQIDSNKISAATPTSLTLRTTNTSGTALVSSLVLSSTDIITNTPTISSTADNSNKIPTTAWVQNVLSSYIPPSPSNNIRRASATGNFTGGSGPNQIFQINLTGSGTSGVWSLNQGVTFRVNYFQSFNPRATTPFDSQNYISFSSMVTLYPYRFSLGWLADVVSGGPRGRVSDNVIVTADGNSNTNYVVLDASTTPNGRQFWSNDASFQSNSSFAGRLFVYGIGGSVNGVIFELSKPNGYSAAAQTYNYNFSVELVNQSNLSSTISSTGFNISNL